jgi:hypothetical protein
MGPVTRLLSPVSRAVSRGSGPRGRAAGFDRHRPHGVGVHAGQGPGAKRGQTSGRYTDGERGGTATKLTD